jgi:class 3 adenylate cyclase
VKAENNDGVVNEDGAVIMLRKAPFFWQTIPFYFLLSLFFVLAGFFVAYLRVRHLNTRAKELNLLVEERTAELAHEKEQSEKLLRNILPPSVAAELKSTGSATPHVYTNTAVLFADIVGFTPWSATLSPDTIIHELNDIFTAFDDIMGKWGCERIKTIGDGYLACCGLPLPEDDYARKIVCAGMDMLRYLDERNLGKKSPVEIRVGIDAGPIVGGVVGVRKYIFDVFGDTVNTAFRLESLSVPMGLTISDRIARSVESEVRILERPPRSVKGKGQMSTYYVCYREDGRGAMNNHAAIAAYTRGLRLFESGKFAECRDLLAAFDYTTVEPEVGYDLCQLASKVWLSLGDDERSREAIARADRFRL